MINYKDIFDELAIDGEGVQPVVDTPEAVQEVETSTEQVDTAPEAVVEEPSYEVDGEKLTAAQIREFKKGSMRQSDYTRKTQELAQARKENVEALEVYNYLRDNPDIAKKLAEYTPETDGKIAKSVDPVSKEIQSLNVKFATMDIERQLADITSKDSDVSDLELLELANTNGWDVKTAYNVWRGQNVDKIIAKKLAEQSKNLTKEIQSNHGITKTLVSKGDKPNANGSFGLSEAEQSMASKLGMTNEEYNKWK